MPPSYVALGTVAAVIVAVPLLYIYTTSVVQTRFPTLRDKRICLLIAHPDDEAMFFAPTVLSLTRPEMGNHVKILCLSSGNAAGLGETRKQELIKSASLLGLRREDDVYVVERPEFPDSMTTTWDAQEISHLLREAFAPHLARPDSRSSKQPTASIDVLVTFDASGISSHPNHISLYYGAKRFISTLTAETPGCASPVDLYTLTSVHMVRKYTGILDMFATTLALVFAKQQRSERGSPGVLVSMSSLFGRRESAATARKAMTDAHISQMVWFRWGWIILSRYMVINDLRLERRNL